MPLLKFFGQLKKHRVLVRRVVGDSMAPTYRPGRIVVAMTPYGRVRAGDIVIIRHAGLEKIKRIQDVRQEHIYVVGDNPAQSTDSRSFGWLPYAVIAGRVVWPRAN